MFRQYGRRSVWALLLVVVIGVVPAVAAFGDAGPARNGARVVAEEQVGPHLVDLTVESPALGRTAKVRLLTPDGWDQRRSSADWPVFYLLHGCCDTYESWTRSTDVEELAQLRNVLVVMPEGGPVGWYSDWWNHGEGGPPAWEAFHLGELRQLLERHYGAGDGRVIAGLSMGGFGALSYAARNPGMFQAAASYSGVVHPLYDGFPGGLMGLLEEFGEDPLALWGDPIAQRSIWEAHDPYYLADRLRSTPVFLSSGDGSKGPFDKRGKPDGLEAFLNEMNHVLASRLAETGVQLTTDFYGPGTHDWPYWERELHRSLPLLLCALGSDQECQGAAA
jgi:diacylglycerol O-acyltransferase / trehalose O-mycolyltransferase / mycolyltransferase Ag85